MNDNSETLDELAKKPVVPTVTNSAKWWLALAIGFFFFVFAFGGAYSLTNALWTRVGGPSFLVAPGCPNTIGVLTHTILFVLFIRLILW